MNTYIFKNARFTILTPGVIRMEYSADGHFIDNETLFAERKAHCEGDFSLDGNTLTVKTDKFTLRYEGNEPFSAENLSVHVHTGNVDTVWHMGDENRDNMRGTLSTLDGVPGSMPNPDSPYGFVDATRYKDNKPTPMKTPDGLIARDGWYCIDDSGKPVINGDWVENRPEGHLFDLYFFAYGHDYKGALRDLCAVSGKASMPRKYFLGSWYSRWHRYSDREFLDIIDGYDENGFPLDVLVADMDWHYQDWAWKPGCVRAEHGYGHATNLGWTGYSWDREVIPDPEGFLKKVHDKGVYITLNDHPADGIRDHEDSYPEFMKLLGDKGYTEQVPDIPDRISRREKERDPKVKNFRFNAGNRDYMEAFFKSTHNKLNDMGVDFWWVDWQQDYLYPEVHGIKGLSHLQWLNRLYYIQSQRNGLRGQGFSRWPGWGSQKYPASFSGDLVTSWSSLEYEIQMTVSAGNAGCFWWAHDIGGFADYEGHQSEVFSRWVQFGAVSAALRTHSCNAVKDVDCDRRPWKWEEPFCSAMRESYHLRSRLIPYIYSAAYQSQRDSLPLLRPLYYDMPECNEAYCHPATYKLGDGLFAAPVYKAGEGEDFKVESTFFLPEGQWYDYFTGKHFDSGLTTVTNGINTFPLFVLAGYPLVEQPYQQRMTSAPLNDPIVKIYTGHGDISGCGELYEDDGVSRSDETNEFRLTKITYNKTGNVHTVAFAPEGAGYAGAVEKRKTLTLELYDTEGLTEASIGEISYDGEKKITRIVIKDVPCDESFEITVK